MVISMVVFICDIVVFYGCFHLLWYCCFLWLFPSIRIQLGFILACAYSHYTFNKFPMWEKSWLIYHISILCNLRQLFMVLFDQIHMDSCPWVPAKKREYNTPFSPPSIWIWGLGPHFILQIYLYKVTDYPSKGLDSLHKKLNIFSST